MPLLTAAVPRYRKHRASGQAVVTLSGQDFYLGPHGTKTSHLEYDRRIAEWLARGRVPEPTLAASAPSQLVKLLVAYKRHAESYYVKEGRPTNEVKMVFAALKILRQLYGREPIAEFGPLKLQAVQQAMIRADWSRGLINKQIGRIKRMFRWGVAQELVPPQVLHAIQEVPGLAKGRTAAREMPPILPVSDEIVSATIARLPPIVADMVRLQKLTGARPEEVCLLRLADVDRSGSIWAYHPHRHKTQHQGRERVIHLGPNAQAILEHYLVCDPNDYVFSPAMGERTRRLTGHAQRRTPLTAGNRPGTNRQREPRR